MAINLNASVAIFASLAFIFAKLVPAVWAHHAFAPAPAPSSHGIAIDQGIACGLMLLALVLTYLIHTLDAPLDF